MKTTTMHSLNKTLLAFLVGVATLPGLANAAVSQFATAPGATATFEAVGRPSMLKIKGNGAKVNGHLALEGGTAKGKFELDLNEFGTGISLRDKHMKEKYLDTAAHPKALLEIESVELPQGWTPGTDLQNAKFKGKMTLKGVTKPVEGTMKVTGADMATEANFNFSLNDYPVGVPSYMGVTVADNVAVSVAIPSFVRK